ncbi:MAG: HYR domain-containing protein, partial [Bacteroidetes bacterium]|nr:HYR domain-containing protein [Bacteroidota bacterium]
TAGMNGNNYRCIITGSCGTAQTDGLATLTVNTPSAPTVGTITQPTCAVPTGSVELTGLPTGTWTINPGAIAGSTTSTTISGLTAGTTYNFTVTNAAGCTSSASVNVVIDAQPETPSAPTIGTITQPTCAVATGSVVLNGLPATGTWTLTRTPGGTTTSGTGTSTTISGLAAGTYTYTVTNAAGCTSVASTNVVINTQPETPTAPVVGTITQPTCTIATGSVELSGLPSSGTWTLTRNPGGTTTTGTGASTTISGLAAGTYTYTVTNAAGCTSIASANVVINTQPETPTVPVATLTQPICDIATGTITVTAPTGVGMTYSIDGSTYTNTTGIFTLVPAGTYTVTAKNSDGCISAGTNVTINTLPPVLALTSATVTDPIDCYGGTATVTIVATGGTAPYSYTFNSQTNTTGVFTGVSAGTAMAYSITDANTCGPVTGTIDVTQPAALTFIIPEITNVSCTGGNDGVIVISATGGTGTINYSILPDIGTQSPVGTFYGLTAQTYIITATDANGCVKTTSVAVGTEPDVTPPIITCPTALTVGTNVACTYVGSIGTATATDNCDQTVTITNDAPAAFPLEATTVTWTATDDANNTATCTQVVTVIDNVNPSITCPAPVTAYTNTGCTATGVALGTPTTSDNCSVASVTNDEPTAFALGNTTVTWTVTDGSGNAATCTQVVTVNDNQNPTISCPANVTVNADLGQCYATNVSLGTPVTLDNCGVASVTNNAPSQFPVGTTTVIWTVTDNAGNTATCQQLVIVTDNQNPSIS